MHTLPESLTRSPFMDAFRITIPPATGGMTQSTPYFFSWLHYMVHDGGVPLIDGSKKSLGVISTSRCFLNNEVDCDLIFKPIYLL